MTHGRTIALSAVLFLLFVSLGPQNVGGIRFTNLRCITTDKSWIVVNLCRLRAKSRDVVTLNIDYNILRVARTVFVNFALLKKANGYKPFLYNYTLNACDYLKRQNNPVLNLMFKAFRNYSTYDHLCPYTGNQKLLDFNLKTSFVPLPLPSGEYALFFKCYVSEKNVTLSQATEVADFQTYFEFIE